VRKIGLSVAAALFNFLVLSASSASAESGPTLLAENDTTVSSDAAGTAGNAGGAAGNGQPANTSATAAVTEPASAPPKKNQMLGSHVGIGVKVSLLGAGIEAATPITNRTNVRVGFNAFSYSRGFTNDGTNYNADLTFRSLESHFDWFPFAGRFHLSPGLMMYNGNQIKANAAVPGGQQFSLGGTSYTSDSANPITGTGKIGFNKVAPSFLLGWGNLIPRGNGHFSIPFEFGVLFQGSPQAALNLTGNACDANGLGCHNIATDTTFQNNVLAQQNKLNNDMSFFKAYPVISLGFGYKF
jgi:hypothetical protein